MKVIHIVWNQKLIVMFMRTHSLSLHWLYGPSRILASMQEPTACSYLRWMNLVHIFPLAKVVR